MTSFVTPDTDTLGSRRDFLARLGMFGAYALSGGAWARETPSGARVRIADVTLVDHNGRRLHLRRDAIGDRVVVASFVFTSCSSVCPLISGVFSQLQGMLEQRLPREVVLLSLTVDPLTDSPDRLKPLAQRHSSGPGWLWLTGRVNDVEAALKGFGAYASRPDEHIPMAVVGDPRTQQWERFMGMPSAKDLWRSATAALNARNAGPRKEAS